MNDFDQETSTHYVKDILQLCFALGLVHFFFNSCGFFFAEADNQKKGNEQLLNDFEEGLIILDTDHNVLFSNKAAKKVEETYDQSYSLSIGREQTRFFNKCNHEQEVFAKISPTLFKESIADSAKTIQALNAHEDY